jgi:ABC-type sugar transport system substrate-binding protein
MATSPRFRHARNRLIPAILTAALTAVTAAACSSAGTSSTTGSSTVAHSSTSAAARAHLSGKRLGISVCCEQPQINEIANALTTNVSRNATGLSATVVNGQASTQKAFQDIQTFLAQDYNAIWTTLITGQGYNNLAAQAARQHIPWVNFSGSAVTGATLNIVIPESQLGYAVGTATAAWMVSHHETTAAIGATIDSTGANSARTQGFVQGVHAKLPRVKVYEVGNDAITNTAAATIGANLLQAHPNIRVLFGWIADDGVGLLQAARQAGDTNPNSFLVATDEGNTQVYQLIASGSPLQIGASLGYPFGAIEGENLL